MSITRRRGRRCPRRRLRSGICWGVHEDHAYYFYYEPDRLTTLNRAFLSTLQTRAQDYLIYADVNALSDAGDGALPHHLQKDSARYRQTVRGGSMGLDLKNYQKRVLRELDAYIALLASTQNLNTAYNRHWHQLGIAVGFGGLPHV